MRRGSIPWRRSAERCGPRRRPEIGAHAGQGEAALMVGIDQLFGAGRHVGQDAQPAEGINPLELAAHTRRDGLAADAMEAVAAGDELAVQPVGLAVLVVGYIGISPRAFRRGDQKT